MNKDSFASTTWLRIGWALSVLGGGFMLIDAILHLSQPPVVIQSFAQAGYPPGVITPVAIAELICIVLYAIPRTSVFGAILLTGYLGGAVDYNVRAGNPLFLWVLAPVYIAIVLWGGLYLRNVHLRAALHANRR